MTDAANEYDFHVAIYCADRHWHPDPRPFFLEDIVHMLWTEMFDRDAWVQSFSPLVRRRRRADPGVVPRAGLKDVRERTYSWPTKRGVWFVCPMGHYEWRVHWSDLAPVLDRIRAEVTAASGATTFRVSIQELRRHVDGSRPARHE